MMDTPALVSIRHFTEHPSIPTSTTGHFQMALSITVQTSDGSSSSPSPTRTYAEESSSCPLCPCSPSSDNSGYCDLLLHTHSRSSCLQPCNHASMVGGPLSTGNFLPLPADAVAACAIVNVQSLGLLRHLDLLQQWYLCRHESSCWVVPSLTRRLLLSSLRISGCRCTSRTPGTIHPYKVSSLSGDKLGSHIY